MMRLQEHLADLETRIRSMPVLPGDHVWERFRPAATLSAKLAHDYALILPYQTLPDQAQALTVGHEARQRACDSSQIGSSRR